MIEIAVLTASFIAGLCTGIVLFIVIGYGIIKKKNPFENLKT